MVGVAVAAALVAVAVPVFASGAGPASAANTAAAISRTAVVVCPTGTKRLRTSSRIERGGRGHGRQIYGCKCLTGTGATGQTGTWGKAVCNLCPAVWSASTGSTATRRLYAGHPILRRWHKIVRRVACNTCPPGGATGSTGPSVLMPTFARCSPCPDGGSTGSSGSTTEMPTIDLCNPCPDGGSTGSSGSTTEMPTFELCNPCPPGSATGSSGSSGATGSSGSTGSPVMPDARILPLLRCHRPPCLSGASGIVSSSVRVAWLDCQPCPGPPTSMARLFGRRGGIASTACNPCPATGSTGTTGSTGMGGTHPTILGRSAIFGCICASVHGQWATGATGATGATSCAPPPCLQPLAAAGRGAMWRSCCVHIGGATGASGSTTSQCSPPPPICEKWVSGTNTGATGSTTSGGYACPAPPKPCMSTSTSGGGQSASWCGGGPMPCNPPQQQGQHSQGAYACPMVAPQSGASVSA